MISTTDIEKIAKLSRLEFSPSEIESFKTELNNIVGYVNNIRNVNTENENIVLNYIDAQTDLRQDTPREFFTQQQAVANAPHKKAGAFSVPTIID